MSFRRRRLHDQFRPIACIKSTQLVSKSNFLVTCSHVLNSTKSTKKQGKTNETRTNHLIFWTWNGFCYSYKTVGLTKLSALTTNSFQKKVVFYYYCWKVVLALPSWPLNLQQVVTVKKPVEQRVQSVNDQARSSSFCPASSKPSSQSSFI